MDIDSFFTSEFEQHRQVVDATRQALREPFTRLVSACVRCVRSGGKIVFFGNGGSAADAQHLATELFMRYKEDRPPIPGLAFTTDTSGLTAIGNDIGFENVFARQVEALCSDRDVVIGLSTSGNSANVNRGLEAARRIGAVAAGFSGKRWRRDDGPGRSAAADTVGRHRPHPGDAHHARAIMFCGALERELGLL